MNEEERRAKIREKSRRYREKRVAMGLPANTRTPEQVAQQKEYMRRRRAEAKAKGEEIPSNTWWKRNPDAHRANVARWRAENFDYSQEINRQTQARRRSTPWGRINNRMWTIVHNGVRAGTTNYGMYNEVLGYTWARLKSHLESQFLPGMTWENWGEAWELDHIKPVSSYKYESIECPTFKECWALSNLRPLWRDENQAKGHKH